MPSKFALFAMLGALAWTTDLTAAPPTSITPNGFGTTVASPTAGFYNITGGSAPGNGSNLFHSFSTFNLGTGNTADFVASANTQNIIARVTGGSASSIDGTITSTVGVGGQISSANLFLINPAGIMFTANAAINLNGAFIASTANYVKLSDGTTFYADTQHPISDAGLTSAPVSAFGFMPAAEQVPAPISFSGVIFSNPGGIHVIGGNLTLDEGATLLAPGGNITLFSAASTGEVPFSLSSPGSGFANATTSSYGNITMQNQSLAVVGGASGGGSLVIRGGQIMFNNSAIAATTSGASAGGNVSVQAVSLSLQNGGFIASRATSTGNGGDISVQGGSVSIDSIASSGEPSGIFASSSSSSAGSVNVNTTGAVSVTNGGEITATASTAGGNISITSGSLSIEGSYLGVISLVSTFGDASATAGSVHVTTGALTLTGGGQLDTQTNGNGGGLFVSASALSADGGSVDPGASSGLNTFSGTDGTSGALQINVTGLLSLTNGATINSFGGSGGEGPITITAGSLAVSGVDPDGINAGIYSAANTAASAGSISVTVAGAADFSDGGTISVATFAGGNAGSILLQAGSLSITGADTAGIDSGIYSEADNPFATGNGGTVQISVTGAVSLTNGGTISASSAGIGNGGDITLNCGSLDISGADPNGITSGIGSLADSSGSGGTLHITVSGPVSVTDGGGISADGSGSGQGGDIDIAAGQMQVDGINSLSLFDSEIASNNIGSGQGGIVNLIVGGALSVTNGAIISADADGSGNAGSVTVQAGQVFVSGEDFLGDQSSISSGAYGAGNGGVVNINAGTVDLANYGQVDALSVNGNAGDITMGLGTLMLTNYGEINTAAAVNGGNIVLRVADLVYLYNSSITASAGDVGGNITIDPELVVLDNSTISAFGGISNGNIVIDSTYFLAQNSEIAATGAISISAPVLDLGGSLLPLPAVLVDQENRLRESCARSIKHEFSSLIVVGRNGTETAPDELQPDFGL